MLKVDVTRNEKGKAAAHIEAGGNIYEILSDLCAVIYGIQRSMDEEDRDSFRVALQWAVLDEDGPIWNLPKVVNGDMEVHDGEQT